MLDQAVKTLSIVTTSAKTTASEFGILTGVVGTKDVVEEWVAELDVEGEILDWTAVDDDDVEVDGDILETVTPAAVNAVASELDVEGEILDWTAADSDTEVNGVTLETVTSTVAKRTRLGT